MMKPKCYVHNCTNDAMPPYYTVFLCLDHTPTGSAIQIQIRDTPAEKEDPLFLLVKSLTRGLYKN